MSINRLCVTQLVTAFLLSCGLVSTTRGGILAGPVVNPANGHGYYLLTESTWQAAEAEAGTLGGHLVTINDAAEQAWVFSTFGSYGGNHRSLWIGLSDAASEGTFVWASGEAVTFTYWLPGQPDSNTIGEDYVHMLRTGNGFSVSPGYWNDLNSPVGPFPQFNPIHGVVEVNSIPAVPEPGSLVGMALGALGLLAFSQRRRQPAAYQPGTGHHRDNAADSNHETQ
jgi:hypothetical protein